MTQTLAIAAGIGLLGALWGLWRERKARSEPVGNVFDRCYRFYDSFIRRSGFDCTAEIRRALLGIHAQGSLLDVGGGTGYLAAQFADLFSRIVVVDSSAGMLSVATQRHVETCQASALALPFEPEQFDVVLCSDALHHIKQADRALAEMYRVLKPGGAIVILEFHIRGLAGWLLFAFERLLLDRSEFLAPDRLQALLDRQGMTGDTHRVSRIQYIYVGQKPAGSATT